MLATAHSGDIAVLFVLLILALFVAAGVALYRGAIAAGAGLALLGIVVLIFTQ